MTVGKYLLLLAFHGRSAVHLENSYSETLAFKKIREFRESFVGYVHRYQIAFRAGTKSYPLEYDW